MTPREQGFLLLTSALGDPERRPLTVAQLRNLAARVRRSLPPTQQRELTVEDLLQVDCQRPLAERILALLSDEQKMRRYILQGKAKDCYPITRVTPAYPVQLRRRLGDDSPGCLWAKGDMSLLNNPKVALVGSRNLGDYNIVFAREAGKQAALQGITLVSGNARGADREAQEACLAHGGNVISVVADALEKHPLNPNILYLSEDGFDLPFTAQRALSRNRVIHALGNVVLVAQCTYGKGGTWDGTGKNLRNGWSPVFCFDDGSRGIRELLSMGAKPVGLWELQDISLLDPEEKSLFDP